MKLFSKLFKKLFKKNKDKRFYHISIWDIMFVLRDWCAEVNLNINQVMFKLIKNTDKSTDILEIYTDRPGVLIGKAGAIIDKYRKQMLEVGSEYRIKYNIKYDIKIELNETHRIMSQQEEDIYLDSLVRGQGF